MFSTLPACVPNPSWGYELNVVTLLHYAVSSANPADLSRCLRFFSYHFVGVQC